MKASRRIWCLPGNLQRATVWNSFRNSLNLELEAVDVYTSVPETMDAWVASFCERVATECQGEKQALLGYSLGGRLAMQALLRAPDLWNAVIIVSSDPGGYSHEQKAAQLAFDRHWGNRFRDGEWHDLLDEWNAQGVFCGIENPIPPRETDFNREQIARVFDVFSKGRQADLTAGLDSLREPAVLLISGELDEKYSAIGRRLAATCTTVYHEIIPCVGHRVPWEAPEMFSETVRRFLERLEE